MGHLLSRRRFLKGAAAAGVLTAAPAVVVRPGWSQTGPIKIGVLEPRSGPVKYVGDKHVAALGYAVEQVNAAGGLLGRKLEIVVADSEMKGDIATRRANDLIFSDKVDFLTGLGSTVGKAASQVASQNRKIFFTPTSEATELTGAEFFDTTFRCTVNTEMHSALLAVYFTKLTPRAYEKLYLLSEDDNFGRSATTGFRRKFAALKRPGQTIVGEEYHPFQRVKDFGPYITKVRASGAEVVITSDWGQDLRLLLQQGRALGWNVTVGSFFLNDPSTLQAIGTDAVGHVTASDYLVTVDSPANTEFVKKWRARYPNPPLESRVPDLTMGRYAECVRWLADIIKKTGSLDTARLIKAWEGAKFDMVWGEVEMRACDHQMQTPGYVAEVMAPERIPQEIRYFGSDFPYIGRPVRISRDDIAQPARDTGNRRCA
jgi:branched-chain amino acid transport system substrate-binding protein